MNTVRTALLMGVMFGLFMAVGHLLGGGTGMTVAFAMALALNFGSYWFSDKIVLRMYKAEEVTPEQAPKLFDMVDRLRQNADLPMPKVYIIPGDQPNAFATGRNPKNGVVAFTQGILRQLSDQELEGVIAHELAHIKNRDILTSSIAATMAGAITYLAYFAMFFGGRDRNPIVSLLLFMLAPLAATIIQMAISRSREYAADKEGAEICRNPQALASALDKLARGVQARPMQQAEASTAHMFIANPFSGGLKGLQSLFSTHPPMEERIERLMQMERGTA